EKPSTLTPVNVVGSHDHRWGKPSSSRGRRASPACLCLTTNDQLSCNAASNYSQWYPNTAAFHGSSTHQCTSSNATSTSFVGSVEQQSSACSSNNGPSCDSARWKQSSSTGITSDSTTSAATDAQSSSA
ncbi:unnamed protein product, partial [Lymnaea stagnalis]